MRYGKKISTALLGFLAGYIIARMVIGAFVPESDFASLDELVKWIGTAEGGFLAGLKALERKWSK